MELLNKKLEYLSNIAIILVAILICIFFIRNYHLEEKSTTSSSPRVNPRVKTLTSGTKISLPRIDFSKNGKTICVLLQPNCPYCIENRPLYQKLAAATAQAKKTKLVMILPDNLADGKSHLAENEFPYDDFTQISLRGFGVNVTPYLFIVDQSGVVIDSWIGKMSEAQQATLFSMIE